MSFRRNLLSQEDLATTDTGETYRTTSSYQTLETKIRRHITHLHLLKSNVQKIQRELQTNVTKVKGEVGSSFSRHFEALRNREVWLLDQVDTVHTAKEEVLQDQLAVLNHLTGSLATLLASNARRDPPQSVSAQLHKISQQIDKLCLEPAEHSGLTFSADRGKLRGAIYNFGHIDSKCGAGLGRPPMASHSLPAPFEDYGDGEQQMSYKSVKGDQSVCKVAVPKLVGKLEGMDASGSSNIRQQIVPLHHQGSLADNGLPPAYGYFTQVAVSSKEDWLLERGNCLTMEAKEQEHLFEPLCYFREISQTDPEDWLTAGEQECCAPVCCLSAPVKPTLEIEDLAEMNCLSPQVMTSSDLETWLYKKHNCDDEKERQEKEECQDDEDADSVSLGDDFEKVEVPTSPSQLPDIQAVCRANECCSTFADCVCDLNCGGLQPRPGPAPGWYRSVSDNHADWLSAAQPPPGDQAPSRPNPLAAWYRWVSNDLSDWLLTTQPGHHLAQSAVFKYFEMIKCSDLSQWLPPAPSPSDSPSPPTSSSPSSAPLATPLPARFDHFSQVANQSPDQWLAAVRPSAAREEVKGQLAAGDNQLAELAHAAAEFSYFGEVQGQQSSCWLLPAKVEPDDGPDQPAPALLWLRQSSKDNHGPSSTLLLDGGALKLGVGSDSTLTWLLEPSSSSLAGAEASLKYQEETKEKRPLPPASSWLATPKTPQVWAEMQKGSHCNNGDDDLFPCFRQPLVVQDWLRV